MRIQYTASVANVKAGAVRVLSRSRALHLIACGVAQAAPEEPPAAPAAPEVPQSIPASVVRQWASEAGVDCPPKGRIPQHVRDAYIEVHYAPESIDG